MFRFILRAYGVLEDLSVMVAADDMLIVNRYCSGHQLPTIKKGADIRAGDVLMFTSHQTGKTEWSEVISITGVEG